MVDSNRISDRVDSSDVRGKRRAVHLGAGRMGIGLAVVCSGVDDGDAAIKARAVTTAGVQAGRDQSISESARRCAAGSQTAAANCGRRNDSRRGWAISKICVRWLPLSRARWERCMGSEWRDSGSPLRSAGSAFAVVRHCARGNALEPGNAGIREPSEVRLPPFAYDRAAGRCHSCLRDRRCLEGL